MNPRVSRSSALASKATGFPIAKVAAKLAVGYTLDEIENDITGTTPASFEPSIDYVVTKIPRFTFEKFPETEPLLTTAMKSVGEVMAIGRTFKESLQKALRGLETGLSGLDEIEIAGAERSKAAVLAALAQPTPDRLRVIAQAFREGLSRAEIAAACAYDPWFLVQIEELVRTEAALKARGLPEDREAFRALKADGFSDRRLARLTGRSEAAVRELRQRLGVRPVFKRIDTCAAEFEARNALHVQRLRGRHPRRSGGRVREPAERPEEGDHPRRRPEPDRSGHRVRLLLRPRRVRPQGGRDRDGDGQLQPRDRLDRPRYLRPALFRAADRGGRARDLPSRGIEGRASGRDRPARRPDPLEARDGSRGRRRADPRHLPRRHRPRRRSRALPAAPAPAGAEAARQRDLPAG